MPNVVLPRGQQQAGCNVNTWHMASPALSDYNIYQYHLSIVTMQWIYRLTHWLLTSALFCQLAAIHRDNRYNNLLKSFTVTSTYSCLIP